MTVQNRLVCYESKPALPCRNCERELTAARTLPPAIPMAEAHQVLEVGVRLVPTAQTGLLEVGYTIGRPLGRQFRVELAAWPRFGRRGGRLARSNEPQISKRRIGDGQASESGIGALDGKSGTIPASFRGERTLTPTCPPGQGGARLRMRPVERATKRESSRPRI